MSQEKVDRYKKEKANRKKILKKEKMKSMAARILVAAVCIGLLGWVGYSGYGIYDKKQGEIKTEITTDALSDYLSSLAG